MTTFRLFWLPLLPLLGACINLLVGKRLRKGTSSLIGCGAVALAAVLATHAVLALSNVPANTTLQDSFFQANWLSSLGDGRFDVHIQAGLVLDRLSSILVMVITWIGLLIHIYASSYMEQDEGFSKFFGYLNLFMGSMLILVLGNSLPVTFVGWEGVGLCSYLLIGFWHQDEKNASAGRKAFIVNRIGDFGFLLGMCLLFGLVGTLQYSDLSKQEILRVLAKPLWFGWPASYFVAAFLFVGCVGKSAQIPLYVWLPDAMAGPTPVSALIHAATMVTAGIYVVARTHGIFDRAIPANAPMLVAGIGAATALFAATIGLVQRDFKKVLAYSTVSQLGFMFVGVGTGNYVAAVFHLVTHACFKAGLFLGAGSVMHAMGGEGDITKMGGLRKKMPITHATFLVYCLAIAGIFPLSGFFSKDAILLGAWGAEFHVTTNTPSWLQTLAHLYPRLLWGALLLAALCTAIYMWRLYFLVFTGKFRGTEEQKHHLHESPVSITLPLVLLALGAIFTGMLGIPAVLAPFAPALQEWLSSWLSPWVTHTGELSHKMEFILMGIALLVSLIGISVASLLYQGGFSKTSQKLAHSLRPIHTLLANKFYIDEIYQILFITPIKNLSLFLREIDKTLVDGMLIKGWAGLINALGKAVRYIQNGDVQRYLVGLVLGVGVIWYIASGDLLRVWELRQAADFEIKSQGNWVQVVLDKDKPTNEHLFYKVKWEGESWPITPGIQNPIAEHIYEKPGTYHITVQVCDSPDFATALCRSSDQLVVHHPHSVTLPTPVENK